VGIRRQPSDAARDLRRITRVFRDEIARRHWGQIELEKLVAESAAAGEVVYPADSEAVRRVLAALDRLSSLHLGAIAANQVLERWKGGTVSAAVVADLVAAFREQSGRAAGDAFAALLAAAPSPVGRNPSPFKKEAARLAALRPSASDVKASLAAIEANRPRRRGTATPFSVAVRDTVGAAAFVDRSVAHVEQLLASVKKTDPLVTRLALLDLMNFIARCASFARSIVTLRLSTDGDER